MAEAHRHRITRAEAIDAVMGIKSTPEGEPDADPKSSPTVTEFFPRWLASRTQAADGTKNNYEAQFRRAIEPVIGGHQLHEVAGFDISEIIGRLQRQFKASTVDRYYAVLHSLFAYAVREKMIPDNPVVRIAYEPDRIAHDDASDSGDDHVYLEAWEYDRILSCAHPDARPLIEFLAGTGCRFSEASAVRVSALDPLACPPGVRIHRAWKHDGKGGWYLGTTKGRRRRPVSIGQAVLDAVLPLAAGEPGAALLFRSPRGGRVDYGNWLERRWNPAVIAAMRCDLHPPEARGRRCDVGGLAGPLCRDNGGVNNAGGPCRRKVRRGWDRCHDHIAAPTDAVSTCECLTRLKRRPTPHDLRHSHVAWQIRDGQTILEISRRLGHSSTALTERVYAGILPDVSAAAGTAFDRIRLAVSRGAAVAAGRPGPGAVRS